jgi:hypothetical protein
MRVRQVICAAMPVIALGQLCGAQPLWDQSDYNLNVPGFFNVESGSPPFGLTQHAVNDVVVGGGGWIVDSITNYYGAADPAWGGAITQGHLHVFDKTSGLPVNGLNDPTTSPLIAMSAVLVGGDHFELTASGLALSLAPGEYWIGITPLAPSGFFGPEPHLASNTLVGDATASYDPFAFPGPPAWFNFNPGVDAAIQINGTIVPGPAGGLALIGLAGFAVRRRRL